MRLPLIALGLLVATIATAAATAPGIEDDAYHFPQFQDGSHDASFAEWWYFNLIVPEEGLRLVVGYAIFSPASAFGRTAVTAAAFTVGGTVQLTESLPAAAFSASTAQADVSVAGVGSIEVVDSGTYRITGALDGAHAISWSLDYVQDSAPWQGSAGERVGILPWERMSWLVYMPAAHVDGSVTIDGDTYAVLGASGYHDHNWGEWIPSEVVWNWAEYHEPGFSFALGDFRNWPTGALGVDVEGERVVFERGQYLLVHTHWAWNAQTAFAVPTRSTLYASNGQYSLSAQIVVDGTVALRPPPELPLPLFEPVIYEQTAAFSGVLRVRTAGGSWTVLRSFEGEGFKEFTGRALAN